MKKRNLPCPCRIRDPSIWVVYFSVFLYSLVQEVPAQSIKLPKLNIDPTKVSVSGFSSGAAMATQFHFAHSGEVFGAGINAGGPYMCGFGNEKAKSTCLQAPKDVNVPLLIAAANSVECDGDIDSTANIRGSKVFIFHGSKDTVVRPASGKNIEQMYKHYGASIRTEFSIPAQHGQEWKLGYYAAFEILNYLYGGSLSRPFPTAKPTGDFLLFDQSEFLVGPPSQSSMDTSGFIYVPTACKSGKVRCSLNIAFHGCNQYRRKKGDKFLTKSGYLQVADLNNIVVLFPQTIDTLENPRGCWDWWGYTNEKYVRNTESGMGSNQERKPGARHL